MDRQGTADRLMFISMLRTMDVGVDERKALTIDQVRQVNSWRFRHDDDLSAKTARVEDKRLAKAIFEFRAQLASDHKQLQEVAGSLVPVSWTYPASPMCPLPRRASPTRTTDGFARERRLPHWREQIPSRRRPASLTDINSTAMVTGSSIVH